MIRKMAFCTVGVLLFSLLVAAAPAMAQRGSEGSGGDALANLISQYVNPYARGEVLTGKVSIRYALVDPFGALYCGESDFPFNMFFQISLRHGEDNWTFFGYGGTTCFFDMEGQAVALQNFISAEVIPNIFRGTPAWAFKSISDVQEIPAGLDGFGGTIEETTLMNLSIAVRGSFR
jgi:hypothetical protein